MREKEEGRREERGKKVDVGRRGERTRRRGNG